MRVLEAYTSAAQQVCRERAPDDVVSCVCKVMATPKKVCVPRDIRIDFHSEIAMCVRDAISENQN